MPNVDLFKIRQNINRLDCSR